MQSIGCFRVPKTLTFKTMLRIVILISMALHFNKPRTETTRKLPISSLFTVQLSDGSTNVHVSKKPTGEPEFSIQLRISCTFGNKWITSSLLFWCQIIVNATLRKYSSAAACREFRFQHVLLQHPWSLRGSRLGREKRRPRRKFSTQLTAPGFPKMVQLRSISSTIVKNDEKLKAR